jgi:alkylhydroperoxidase family enzyme
MTMARIPYFQPAEEDHEKKLLQGKPPFHLNIFKMITHAPTPLARAFISLPATVLMNGKLDPMLREMAITRVGILCHSPYEVHQHRIMCKRVGIPEDKINALEVGSTSPVFSEIEKLVLRFSEETVLQHTVSDATFSAMRKHFSYELLVELSIAACCYMAVSTFLNTFEVDIEDQSSGPSVPQSSRRI